MIQPFHSYNDIYSALEQMYYSSSNTHQKVLWSVWRLRLVFSIPVRGDGQDKINNKVNCNTWESALTLNSCQRVTVDSRTRVPEPARTLQAAASCCFVVFTPGTVHESGIMFQSDTPDRNPYSGLCQLQRLLESHELVKQIMA